jgi:23S rRNA (pseudouridine1915-N3)-methyltransferase
MQVNVIAVGRLKAGPERDLCGRYSERFQTVMRSCGVQGLRIVELAESPARRSEDRQNDEARAILAALQRSGAIVALDERGKQQTSAEFAEFIVKLRGNGMESLSFIVGGPDGLAPEIREKAVLTLAFGKLTMPHQIVRALLFEQLYRAATILSGHPYHRT